MPRTITVASGKGGVGKTNISINLAIQLARRGQRVCLFDADLGLANIDILLGIYPEFNLAHVLDGHKRLTDIVVRNYMGVDIVPGGSGISRLANLTPPQMDPVMATISALDSYDIIFFDASAGADRNVTAFCRAASQVLLVVTPEPTSLTDAYSLLKILKTQGLDKPVWVIVNEARNRHAAQVVYQSLSRAVAQHLGLSLTSMGFITQDPLVTEAVKCQKPFSALYPKTIASACVRALADQFLSRKSSGIFPTDMSAFWRTFLEQPPGLQPPCAPQRAPHLSREPLEATAAPPAGGRDLQEIKAHLSVIETQINAIVRVMASLEKRLSDRDNDTAPPAADESGSAPIPLDFEAYLAKRAGVPDRT